MLRLFGVKELLQLPAEAMDELSKDVGVVALDGGDLGAVMHVGGGGVGGAGSPSSVVPPDGGYLDGLLREKDSLGTNTGMDLTKRLVNQGKTTSFLCFLFVSFILLCSTCTLIILR